jgi:4-amino-4-deoxy-L-arabinose transferase-like glycosyltransferase
MRRPRFLVAVVLIAGAAFCVRAVYVVAVARHLPNPSLTSNEDRAVRSIDELRYEFAANQLVDGDFFKAPLFGGAEEEDAYQPPLTPMALAPVAWATGGNRTAMRLAVALFGAGTVLVIGFVGRAVAGDRVGLIAATIAAIYPNLWVNDGLLLTEAFAALTTALALLFAYRVLRRARWPDLLGFGAAVGLAMLTRSESVLLVPFLLLPVLFTALRSVGPRRMVALASIAVLGTGLVVGPWVGYNLSRFERPVFVTTGYGDGLIGANCEGSYYGSSLGLHDGRCGLGISTGEQSVDAELKRERAVRYIRENLGRVPLVVAARVGYILSVYRPFRMADLQQSEGRPEWVSLLGLATYWPLVLAAGFGIASLWSRKRTLLPLIAVVGTVLATAVVSWGLLRFRTPAEVSLVVLAAVGIDAVIRRRSAGSRAPVEAAPPRESAAV